MSEDWSAVAAEVAEAIRSVGDTSQAGGYPITLRRPPPLAGPVRPDPWNPPTPAAPIYTTLRAVDTFQQTRDRDGTLIGETRRTLLVEAAGVVPTKADRIAVGIEAGQADENSAWLEIMEVRPLSPAGVDLLYEIDIAF